jgi:hypothetical protein
MSLVYEMRNITRHIVFAPQSKEIANQLMRIIAPSTSCVKLILTVFKGTLVRLPVHRIPRLTRVLLPEPKLLHDRDRRK